MKLYIPEIGDIIRLSHPWTFDLYDEDRNSSLMEIIGDTRKISSRPKAIPCTIPTGAELKIDRIYIRKGISDYSSITFLWIGKRTQSKLVERGNGWPPMKIPARPARFWAKLSDVNNIEFDKI